MRREFSSVRYLSQFFLSNTPQKMSCNISCRTIPIPRRPILHPPRFEVPRVKEIIARKYRLVVKTIGYIGWSLFWLLQAATLLRIAAAAQTALAGWLLLAVAPSSMVKLPMPVSPT